MQAQYGLIGKNLGHSFSSLFFNEKFKRERIDAKYSLFSIDDIKELLDLINNNQALRGFNVTIPYKEKIIPFLDSLSDAASAIGAVNVVKIIRTNRGIELQGYNSDWIGFTESLDCFKIKNIRNALILGSGGASKAVRYALQSIGISCLVVSHSGVLGSIDYSEITKELLSDHMLIVNTTPLGMFPDIKQSPPLPYDFITASHICYDLVYNPGMTEFMNMCADRGATVKNGLQMLYRQAEESWRIWTR